MISRSPNVTRLIDKLITAGLARREQGTRDRRQAFVRLTPAGRRRLRALNRVMDEGLGRMDLSDRESAALIRLLDKIRARVGRPTVVERARGQAEARRES